jgi:protein-tyrosine-phosphatase
MIWTRLFHATKCGTLKEQMGIHFCLAEIAFATYQAKTGLRRLPGQAQAQRPRFSIEGGVRVMGNSVQIRSSAVSRRQFGTASVLLAVAAVAGCSKNPKKPKLKILFVCQAGTAKSAIAREIFRRKAALAGIDVDVFSRGILIEDHVSPELREKLDADRLDTLSERAEVLLPADASAAHILVKFNPLPATIRHSDIRDWTDTPSVNDDYSNARRVMDQRIDALIAEIGMRQRGKE